jgi:hypothetical protein
MKASILCLFILLLCTCGRAQKDAGLMTHPLLEEYTLESPALTKFWGKPMMVKAAVLLPSGYTKNQDKFYPVRYNIAGYGGRYTRVNRLLGNKDFAAWWTSSEAPQIITVFLDGDGPFGDPYQLNSANSGPYGDVLINEVIPAIDKKVPDASRCPTLHRWLQHRRLGLPGPPTHLPRRLRRLLELQP